MYTSDLIDTLYKIASYLKPIKCDDCGYDGKPLGDGRCPDCGAICGIKPKSLENERVIQEYSRERSTQQFNDMIEGSRLDYDLML